MFRLYRFCISHLIPPKLLNLNSRTFTLHVYRIPFRPKLTSRSTPYVSKRFIIWKLFTKCRGHLELDRRSILLKRMILIKIVLWSLLPLLLLLSLLLLLRLRLLWCERRCCDPIPLLRCGPCPICPNRR